MKHIRHTTFLFLALAVTVTACSVPVFRYALERWWPDVYPATVTYSGQLSEADLEQAERLGVPDYDSEFIANVYARTQQVETAESPQPMLTVKFPPPIERTLWSGPLTKDAVDKLLDSPVRKAIRKRILSGESAVFLFVGGKNAESNTVALTTLTNEIATLEKELQLPEIAPHDRAAVLDGSAGPELKIDFSVIEIKRDDPAEEVLVNNLLEIDEEFAKIEEPLVFATFGRGRALPPLIGEQITPEIIQDVCFYIVGQCSCEIKAQNIGFDLLMNGNWDAALMGEIYSEHELPPLTGVMPEGTDTVSDAEQATNVIATISNVITEAAQPQKAEQAETTSFVRKMWVVLAALVAVVIGGSVLILRRR
jgi:hypothetical protein